MGERVAYVEVLNEASPDVLDAARGVLGDLDVERVVEHVLDSARQLTGARYAAMGVLDESPTTLEQFITAGIEEPARRWRASSASRSSL
jgi:hypothetical protein